MKICLYTTQFGNYDRVSPRYFESNVDFIVFSDIKNIKIPGWKVIYIDDKRSSIEKNRELKFNPYKYLGEYEISLYLDASIEVTKDPYLFIIGKMDGVTIYLSKHPRRNNYLEEAASCAVVGADSAKVLLETIKKLSRVYGFAVPGLYECGLIIRKHSDSVVKSMCEEWFDLWLRESKRDQLYAPVLINKYKPSICIENFPAFRSPGSGFNLVGHLNKSRKIRKIMNILLNNTVYLGDKVEILKMAKNARQ